MNWWWRRKQEEPKQFTFSDLSQLELKWEEVRAQAPMPNEVGNCIFCAKVLYRMDDHFTLEQIGPNSIDWGEVLCCQKCAVDKGLKW